MNLIVRAEQHGDAETIRALNDAAFDGPVEGAIVDGIRGTDRWIDGGSLVAETNDGTIVGHLLASRGDLIGADGGLVRTIWMVGPVAVLPDRQRRGAGSALMHAVIELATSADQPVICLLGDPAYYTRFGFEPARAIFCCAMSSTRMPRVRGSRSRNFCDVPSAAVA